MFGKYRREKFVLISARTSCRGLGAYSMYLFNLFWYLIQGMLWTFALRWPGGSVSRRQINWVCIATVQVQNTWQSLIKYYLLICLVSVFQKYQRSAVFLKNQKMISKDDRPPSQKYEVGTCNCENALQVEYGVWSCPDNCTSGPGLPTSENGGEHQPRANVGTPPWASSAVDRWCNGFTHWCLIRTKGDSQSWRQFGVQEVRWCATVPAFHVLKGLHSL